ncbi:MAG: hypothetical protein ABIZ81_01705, partial [Opitutaceae bacterium]
MTTEPKPAPFARCPTGIEGLDHVLGGGLPAHRLYEVQGHPGVDLAYLADTVLIRIGSDTPKLASA